MFTYTSLQKSGFKFSPDDPLMVHDDRMRGIIRWGPYRKVANPAPRLALLLCCAGINAAHAQTILVVTHDPSWAARSDRVLRLLDGRIVADERKRGGG